MSQTTARGRVRARIVSTATETRFEPGWDTAVAVLSLLALWGIYYYQSTSGSVGSLLLFLLVGNLGLTVLFPLYYVCYRRSGPLSAVGITADGWRRALFASAVGALALSPGLLSADEPLGVLIPHVVATGLMLWEPFFVHGWLQIRFERAFGAGPGVVLAAAAFGLFHLGAVALTDLLVLLRGRARGALPGVRSDPAGSLAGAVGGRIGSGDARYGRLRAGGGRVLSRRVARGRGSGLRRS